MSKKLEQKQQRREAEERRKKEAKRAQQKKNLITLGIAALVIALVAALVISDRKAAEGPVGVAAEEAGCGPKDRVEASEAEHVEEGTQVQYNSTPPSNGSHYANASPAGFFTTAVEPERVVHNLEHGMIVIWYDPAAPQAVKDDIEALVDREPATTVATPYEDGLDKNFYLTAWNKLPSDGEESQGNGYVLGCDAVAQEVVDDFRREHQGLGPERITPPFEG